MSALATGGGTALLLEPGDGLPTALRGRIADRLHRRLDLAGSRPAQPIRIAVVTEAGEEEALLALSRANAWKVDRRAPDVLAVELSAQAFDDVLVAHLDRWEAADLATKLSGLRIATRETEAHVAIAAPEDRWPELARLGLTGAGQDGGLVTGTVTGAELAGLVAAAWIEAIDVRAVSPAVIEPETEDEELDPSADPIPDDADDDPADAIGPPIQPADG